jgi:hypothetical protein
MHRLIGPSLGSPARFEDLARTRQSERFDDVVAYLQETYRLAALAGIPAHIAVCQAIHETDWWRSAWWRTHCNPAGIGITGDPGQNGASRDFRNGRTAARAHLVHLALYVYGVDRFPAALREFQHLDPRWQAAIDRGYAGTVQTLAGLTGTWAVDSREPDDPLAYHEKIERLLAALDFDAPAPSPASMPYVLIVAGHRSTGDGGDPNERALTDDLARGYERACLAAGIPVSWYQRDHDGDDLPDLTQGNLSTLSLGAARTLERLIAARGLVVLADLHFNGPASPVHVIVAHNRRQDGRGPLDTAFAQGRVPADLADNNTLDVTLAGAVARSIVDWVPGMSLWRVGRSGVAGVMLENETGVGDPAPPISNARLAIMAATAPYRQRAVRLTIEHGGWKDASKLDFFNRCGRAFVQALEEVMSQRPLVAGSGASRDTYDGPSAPPSLARQGDLPSAALTT